MTLPPNQVINYCRILSVVVFLPVFYCTSLAQDITPVVLNTDGFSKDLSDGSITISIGETSISTLFGSNSIITQGFLQPELKPPCSDFVLNYFPNPVTDFITIRDTACGRIINEIVAHDLLGHEVLRARLVNRTADLRLLRVGVFIIQGYSLSGEFLGSFKIIKIEER